ncbi:MAG: hypothetical protein KC964_14450 [Candidatus Omnitrophica bacterium]|nr:hypothetical protein [Candidatus Omnitrophota bacterium]
MNYKGIVKNGNIELENGVHLPDGTPVSVEVEEAVSPSESEPQRTLYEIFEGIIGSIDDFPEDMAKNHDHYLHGAPKK